MSSQNNAMFEQRLASLMRGVLDAETGPHAAWADSPAARRVAGGEGAVRRFGRPPLRLLALAAVLAIGGVALAVAGGFLRLNETTVLPVPSLPVPTAPLPSAPVDTATAAPALTNGWIAYVQEGGGVAVQKPGGDPVSILGRSGISSCPQFGPDGLLAFRLVGEADTNPTSWDIVVIRMADDGKSYEFVDTLTIDERPTDSDSCFEWSPDGTQFAYDSPIENDGQATIASHGRSYSPLLTSRDDPPAVPDSVRWNQDGSAVAIVQGLNPPDSGPGYHSTIWIAPVDGSGPRELLTTDPGAVVNEVAFSPDGKWLAYRGTNFDVVEHETGPSVEPVGTFVRLIPLGAPGEPSPIAVDELNDPEMTMGAGPVWSPDGSHLAWVLGGELRVGGPVGEDWRGMRPVSSDELGTGWAAGPVVWSVDGSQILSGQLDQPFFDRGVSTSVVLYDVDGYQEPRGFLPWTLGGYGRVSWQVLPE